MEWRGLCILATKPPTFANRSAMVHFLSSHGVKGNWKPQCGERKFPWEYRNYTVAQWMWIASDQGCGFLLERSGSWTEADKQRSGRNWNKGEEGFEFPPAALKGSCFGVFQSWVLFYYAIFMCRVGTWMMRIQSSTSSATHTLLLPTLFPVCTGFHHAGATYHAAPLCLSSPSCSPVSSSGCLRGAGLCVCGLEQLQWNNHWWPQLKETCVKERRKNSLGVVLSGQSVAARLSHLMLVHFKLKLQWQMDIYHSRWSSKA